MSAERPLIICPQSFVPASGNIPDSVSRKYVKATHPNVKLALEFIRYFPTEKLDRIGNDSRFQTILKTVKR
jgi:hypothetical protein